MSEGVLVLNAGSSSIKFALYVVVLDQNDTDLNLVVQGQVSGIGSDASFHIDESPGHDLNPGVDETKPPPLHSHHEALQAIFDWLDIHKSAIHLVAVGHRVVHGGDRVLPAVISPALLSELQALSPLAPHHQSHNLAAVEAVYQRDPDLLQVACFDTAFHAQQPDVARRLPLPAEYTERGLVRYGFHGLSYQSIIDSLPHYNEDVLPTRLIVAHLGNGASLCAIKNGVSIATTMGFSTLDGLIMGTRCGVIDPGVLLHLMKEEGFDEPALSDLLYNRSGLLGISGISSDMQILLASDTPQAAEAVEQFCYTVIRAMGSLAAALEGINGIVFTGGIGEHAVQIRARLCTGLAWLGLKMDPIANQIHQNQISLPDSTVKVWVIPSNEERVIAQATFNEFRLLK